MQFPKPTEQNINMSREDLEETSDMEKLTKSISDLIADKENEIESLYSEFSQIANWISSQNDLGNAQGQLTTKLAELEGRLQSIIEVLKNVLLMTKHEEKKDCRKVMIKNDIAKDFDMTENFAKQLNYPSDVVHLAKEICQIAERSKDEADEDLQVEKETEKLIVDAINMLQRIETQIAAFSRYVMQGDFNDLQDKLQQIINEMAQEEETFKKLSNVEKTHLNLLLKLYHDEETELKKEFEFADDEKRIKPKEDIL